MAYYELQIPATVFLGIEVDHEDDDYSSITGITVDVRPGRHEALVYSDTDHLMEGPNRKRIIDEAYHPEIPWPIPHYEVQT